MQKKDAIIFAISILSILSIFLITNLANASISSAVVATGTVSLSIKPPLPKTICGNGICEKNEICPADCQSKEEISKNIHELKLSYLILIVLVVVLCTLSYLYLKEDRPPISAYWRNWRYGYS